MFEIEMKNNNGRWFVSLTNKRCKALKHKSSFDMRGYDEDHLCYPKCFHFDENNTPRLDASGAFLPYKNEMAEIRFTTKNQAAGYAKNLRRNLSLFIKLALNAKWIVREENS